MQVENKIILEDLAHCVLEKKVVWRCKCAEDFDVTDILMLDGYQNRVLARMMNHWEKDHAFELWVLKGKLSVL